MAILQSVQFYSKRGRIRLKLQHYVVPLIQPFERLEKIRTVIVSGTLTDAFNAYRTVVQDENKEASELKKKQLEEEKIKLEEQNRLTTKKKKLYRVS